MSPDYAEALVFLEWWRPGGPWTLVAIGGIDDITARTFQLGEEADLLEWLEVVGRRYNIYFCVNSLLYPLNKKPLREDVAALDWLHVDIDPRAGEDIDEERERILALLESFEPKPSAIVFSGGGYQGFWRLEEPLPIKGDLPAAEDAKRYNLQLESLFGADSCHNVDRIMRLPGTINRPDEKKRKRGRTPKKSYVVRRDDVTYPISAFTKAPQVQGAEGSAMGTVKISGNIRRLENVDELPESVPLKAKEVIVQGTDPEQPNRWGGDRSAAVWWICCELVRHEVSDEVIFSVITDPDFAISAHVLAQGSRWQQYAIRQIEKAKDNAVNPVLRELNDEYAVITNVGGKCRILAETEELVGAHRRSRVHYMSFEDFRNAYMNRLVIAGTDKDDNPIRMPAGKWWLQHPRRRQYGTVTFAPEREVPGAYNLWKGFAFEAVPAPSKCQLFLGHMRDVICSGEQDSYDYLLRWMALAVQKPAQPGHVAVVMRGGQGTGKGSFANHFGALWGRHYMVVSNAEHLFGRFNAHLLDCCLLFADEAFWAGNKKHEGQLKALVTEDMLISERKNFDAQALANYLKIIMASNSDWVIPAEVDDRRFFVLDVSEDQKQDRKYFAALTKSMEDGGYEALLHYLLSFDLTGFEVRNVPQTRALREQKIHSFSPEQEWWYHKLQDGRILPHAEWPERVLTQELTSDFTAYCKSWGNTARSNSTRLGQFLARVLPKGVKRIQLTGSHQVMMHDGSVVHMDRPRAYSLRGQTLETCRKFWDDNFGGPYEWSDPVVESEEDNPKEAF